MSNAFCHHPKAYYRSLDQAVALGIVRKEVHPETGKTWLVLDDGALPFLFNYLINY